MYGLSILETDKIDGIGKGKNNKELFFMIADHLDWSNEYEHLKILQEKINSYIGYIESRQFHEIYPNETFEFYIIEVHFKYQITEKCLKFIDVVSKQLSQHNIKIVAEIV